MAYLAHDCLGVLALYAFLFGASSLDSSVWRGEESLIYLSDAICAKVNTLLFPLPVPIYEFNAEFRKLEFTFFIKNSFEVFLEYYLAESPPSFTLVALADAFKL
jgi:hypothetical protein